MVLLMIIDSTYDIFTTKIQFYFFDCRLKQSQISLQIKLLHNIFFCLVPTSTEFIMNE